MTRCSISHSSVSGKGIPPIRVCVESLIWEPSRAPCAYLVKGGRQCPHLGHGYSVLLQDIEGHVATVASSWTRGLAIHPVCKCALDSKGMRGSLFRFFFRHYSDFCCFRSFSYFPLPSCFPCFLPRLIHHTHCLRN